MERRYACADGPHALTMADMAELAAEVTGREVRHVTVSDVEWRDAQIKSGMPAIYAEMLLGTFQAARRVDFASTGSTVQSLLGRSPQTMRDVLIASGL